MFLEIRGKETVNQDVAQNGTQGKHSKGTGENRMNPVQTLR